VADGRKNHAPLGALALRGGQGCRGIRARRISVLGNATRPGVFRQTAAIRRSARFFVRSTRPSLRLAARDVLPPSGEAAVGARSRRRRLDRRSSCMRRTLAPGSISDAN